MYYLEWDDNVGGYYVGLDCLVGDCNGDGTVSIDELVVQAAVKLDGRPDAPLAPLCRSQLVDKALVANYPTPEAESNDTYVIPLGRAVISLLYGYGQAPGKSPRPTLTATATSSPANTPTRTPTPSRKPTRTFTPAAPPPVGASCRNAMIDPLCAGMGVSIGVSVDVRDDLVGNVVVAKAVGGIDGAECLMQRKSSTSHTWYFPVGCFSGSQAFRSYAGGSCPRNPDNTIRTQYQIKVRVEFTGGDVCETFGVGNIKTCAACQ